MPHSISRHVPILVDTIIDFFRQTAALQDPTAAPGVLVDCTFGGGGHSREILKLLAPTSHVLIGMDQDPEAIERAQVQFAESISKNQLELYRGPFSSVQEHLQGRPVYGILADLGISSDQIDSESRGFSFRFPAPLDMRMNPDVGNSLQQWLATVNESDLAQVIWEFGEERNSRKIARRLIQLRERGESPTTAAALAEAISHVFPPSLRYRKPHPATQTFQAFRIFLNNELQELETLLTKILPSLQSGGRIAILSFHSLEDRRVKHALRDSSLYSLEQRKAYRPSDEEVESNPRSRSTRLRLATKC